MFCDAVGGGVSAVCGAESVVDEDRAKFGELGAEFEVALFFAREEADVFKESDLAFLKCFDGGFGGWANDFWAKDDFLVEEFFEVLMDWGETEFGFSFAIGPT